ncbi:putative ribosomal protein L36A [Paratrimastix pyriformis]|uniref:Ribosomal protein L36A n=1 Tax=Paratrimastix pyriformis TaxID=342808 RepID=A0ABQ8UYG6_9EUKA|nr:putative ribosomal protein L36A [Paratrimastix pyriformis]
MDTGPVEVGFDCPTAHRAHFLGQHPGGEAYVKCPWGSALNRDGTSGCHLATQITNSVHCRKSSISRVTWWLDLTIRGSIGNRTGRLHAEEHAHLIGLRLDFSKKSANQFIVPRYFPLQAAKMVNVPKRIRTFCPKLKKHTLHKVTQYKQGKASLYAQGKRRYDRKQKGFGGQTKQIFRKKAKTTKKIVLMLECTESKYRHMKQIKRCKKFELGAEKKGKRGSHIYGV